MTPEFSIQFFEQYSKMKSHEDPYSGSQVIQCGETDGQTHEETNCHFPQICDRT